MHNFKELNVWKEAMELTKSIFLLTKKLPVEERYGLLTQMNRSALSIPSNIAEGSGRESAKAFNQFLNIAQGSCFELEHKLFLAVDFNYMDQKEYETTVTQ